MLGRGLDERQLSDIESRLVSTNIEEVLRRLRREERDLI